MPELVEACFSDGVVGRAHRDGVFECHLFDPRAHVSDVHRSIDDRPFGGGPGMVMLAEPLKACLEEARAQCPYETAPTVYLSPQGERLDQRIVKDLAQLEALILLSGRYEGVDQRLIDQEVDQEISLGDFVISGGELAAMVIIDAVVRLLPGAVNNPDSVRHESFVGNFLDFPQYTRPRVYQDSRVPDVLLSGDHAAVGQWRCKSALLRTWQRRPELLSEHQWTDQEKRWLKEYVAEISDIQES